MNKNTKNIKPTLKTWLFNKPMGFVAKFVTLSVLFLGLTYIPGIQTVPAIDVVCSVILLTAFFFIVHSLIKSIPYKNISNGDFIAIINGYRITSIVSLITLAIIQMLEEKLGSTSIISSPTQTVASANNTPVVSETWLVVLQIIWFVLAAYILGLWISGIYVKYRRAKDMGISGWKAILSMPFTFIMAWMPGYLISDRKQTTITIKSNWYSKFNNWVIANTNNTLFIFLFLFIFMPLFITTNISAILFPLALFAIYVIWKTLSKSSFIKDMNHGYMWTAIIINLLMVMSFVRMIMVILSKLFN